MNMSARRARWLPAYVGVGSNLDAPVVQVQRAIEACRAIPQTRVVSVSPSYRSKPLGQVAQADFVNAVLGVLTQLTPEAMLAELASIERQLGRKPSVERWGPRCIDLDLLVFGNERRATATLQLPHPGIAERDFVVYPLCDVAPHLEVPGLGRVEALRAQVADRGLRAL